MEITKLYCDTCGREIYSRTDTVELSGHTAPTGSACHRVKLDLCQDCIACFWNIYFIKRERMNAPQQNSGSGQTSNQQLKQSIALVRREAGLRLSIQELNLCENCLNLIEQRACV